MGKGMDVVIYPVSDLAKAKGIFAALLGTEPYVDSPYYVGFRADGSEVGLDPTGHGRGMTGPVGFVDVDDITAALEALVEAGAEVVQEPQDVGGGMQIARLKDPDGNGFGLRQAP